MTLSLSKTTTFATALFTVAFLFASPVDAKATEQAQSSVHQLSESWVDLNQALIRLELNEPNLAKIELQQASNKLEYLIQNDKDLALKFDEINDVTLLNLKEHVRMIAMKMDSEDYQSAETELRTLINQSL